MFFWSKKVVFPTKKLCRWKYWSENTTSVVVGRSAGNFVHNSNKIYRHTQLTVVSETIPIIWCKVCLKWPDESQRWRTVFRPFPTISSTASDNAGTAVFGRRRRASLVTESRRDIAGRRRWIDRTEFRPFRPSVVLFCFLFCFFFFQNGRETEESVGRRKWGNWIFTEQ